jgi:hypothetical protein
LKVKLGYGIKSSYKKSFALPSESESFFVSLLREPCLDGKVEVIFYSLIREEPFHEKVTLIFCSTYSLKAIS